MESEEIPFTKDLLSLVQNNDITMNINNFKIVNGKRTYKYVWTDCNGQQWFKWEFL